jgi:diguanylate cyclase (GGDEF)-like protein
MPPKTVFDLLDQAEPETKKADAKTVFDFVQMPSQLTPPGGAEEISAPPGPTPGSAPLKASESPTERKGRSFKITGISPAPGYNVFKRPLASAGEAIREQYEEGMKAVETGNTWQSLLGGLAAVTSPLAPVFNPIDNAARTVFSMITPLARQIPDEEMVAVSKGEKPPPPIFTEVDKQLIKGNLSRLANIAGGERPTTGSPVGDIVAGITAGAVPLKIPVAGILKALRLPERYAPAVERAAKTLVSKGIPNEEKALAAEIGKAIEPLKETGAIDRRMPGNAAYRELVERMTPEERVEALFTSPVGILNERAFKSGPPAPVVASIDLDKLKRINDVYGHDAGDAYLRHAAKGLNEAGVPVFHLHGDEFAAKGQTAEEINSAMERARQWFAENPFTVGDEKLTVGFSYGTGADLSAADKAMMKAKNADIRSGLREERRTRRAAPKKAADLVEAEKPIPGVEPEVKPLVDQTVEMRLQEIHDIFTSGLGEVSGKGKTIDRLEDMHAAAAAAETQGFGKVRVKGMVPEVENFKESPGRIAAAIKKDKNNPLYLRVKEKVQEGVLERHADDIQAANEAALERRAIMAESEEIDHFADTSKMVTSDEELPKTVFDLVEPEQPPMSVGQFAEEAAAAQMAQRQAAAGEAAQNILNAPEASVSKRDLLGLNKKKAGKTDTPLFGEPQQDMFASVGGRVSKFGQKAQPSPAAPPAGPGSAAPQPPSSRPAPAGSILAEVERITQAEPVAKPKANILQAVPKKVQTSVVSEFTPLRDLERTLYTGAGKPVPVVDLARKFEQVAGAPAKAEADVIVFRQAVVDPIREMADDFNSYLFLKRTEDRLAHNPEVKKVGDWTVDKARAGLAELEAKLGPDNMKRLENAGKAYQAEMDKALQLQVASGRMSQEVFDKIKSSSDFYARFKVLKYFEDAETMPSGTGRNIATTQDLTKAISGIEEADLQIGNILQASAEQIVRSRILAEKNLKMLELDQLAALDKEGTLIRRAQPTRYYKIEAKPAEDILHQLGMQQTARNPQLLEQSFIKVGKAIQYAEEVGLKVKQRIMRSLGRATLGGADSGGRVSLNAFTSETIAHELGHSFDTILRDAAGNPITKTKKVFGRTVDVPQRLSSEINAAKRIDPKAGKPAFGGQNEFQRELSNLVDFTGLGGSPKYRNSAKERFAEFLQLYIHDPAKARELAPTWTAHFESNILPNQKVQDLVEKLSKFFQKVDKLPNIMTRLKELDDANYLELAIRRAFPDKAPQIGVRFGTKPAPGNEIVNYFRDGKVQALEVSKDVAQAIQGLNAAQTGLITKALAATKVPLQWGATSANAGFQVVNLLFADLPRTALISRYGLRELRDVYQFPLDWAYSFYTSMRGNFGKPNDLFMEWLRSGAANSTIQREITPAAFKATLGLQEPMGFKRVLAIPREKVLDNIAKFANAIEETSKITGLKRGIRIEGKTPAAIEKIVAEVRNYSGSPDFLRKGKDTVNLNLLVMFFNARVQGVAADLTRLAGKTGSKEAGAAWARLSAAVGIPATILAMVNMSDGYREDYAQVPEWERRNYFMIPRDSYFYNDNGEKVRDYWRVPKREIVSIFANLIENAVEFGAQRDPEAFTSFASDALETLSPLNIQGKDATERLESVIGSLNPIAKTPIELATNRDTFRHQAIVPEYMKNAPAEEQYRHTTPKEFVAAGQAAGISPLKVEHTVKSVTGGGLTQFSMGKPQPGRSRLATAPVAKRFVRSGSLEGEDTQAAITEAEQKETADSLRQRRRALELLQEWKRGDLSKEQRQEKIAEIRKTDPQLAKKVAELNKEQTAGITYQDKQVKALGVQSGARAEFIAGQLKKLKTEMERELYLQKLRQKKLLTPEVARQLKRLRKAG